VDRNSEFVSARYDQLAGFINFLEWIFFLPPGLRKQAVDRIALEPGDRVLEVGCGTGRNLPFLRERVGPGGQVYGVDLSSKMLAQANDLCARRGWSNVSLSQGDAVEYKAPVPLDGVLFSLSYNTMPHHLAVLDHVLTQLRPGGRIVIMDAKLPPGRAGAAILPFAVWLNDLTVLGNPHIRPWQDLAPLVDDFEMEERLFGAYYICRGRKRIV
jgi:ubiquinone/menaquinone biosynthesis C-methylase UbiE